MKAIAFASLLVLAGPAMAQTAATNPATQTDPAMAPTQPGAMGGPETDQPVVTTTGDPVGGYQPAGSPISGTPMPGSPVVTTASPSPDQAYPAPAPLAHYPRCSRTVTDHCMQRGGR